MKKAICIFLSLLLLTGCAGDAGSAAVSTEEKEYRARSYLLDPKASLIHDAELKPSVSAVRPAQDLSDVNNREKFSYFSDAFFDALAKDGFAVWGTAGSEFFEIYESNRYDFTPNFVTVDSMMHTYHLYFAHLLKQTEKGFLSDGLKELGERMLEHSIEQYDIMKGTAYEESALLNTAFFNVGVKLMDHSAEIFAPVKDIVEEELSNISDASIIADSPLMPDTLEDYSQYKPRGYYDGDPLLESYFRTMMWYGRRNFAQKDDKLLRSALLMTLAIDDEETFAAWERIYTITSFFAGASDDAGYYDYLPLIDEAYGERSAEAIAKADESAFAAFRELTAKLEPPAINSVPVPDTDEEVSRTEENKGFRFMGQRFSVDASIFQRLIYREVKENEDGEKRMLPNGLDIPAALGSDTALDLLRESGETGYKGYEENMEELRKSISEAPETLWSASLYARWLDTLRPLLKEKGEGYPYFMQGEKWSKKSLEGFLGSWSELKHDTVLYSKQVIAEMGGGMEDEALDYRGYVEPEPEVFSRLAVMTAETANGLSGYGVLDEDAERDMTRLSELSEKLMVIAEKELRNEVLSDEEYLLIEDIGGNLEHFWLETVKDSGSTNTYDHPAAIITDVATDPDGRVLEVGTANPSIIYVVCEVDGVFRIARGPVFTYYEFAHPLSDRLTDIEWRIMLGMDPDEDGNYNWPPGVEQPDWTADYRIAPYDE